MSNDLRPLRPGRYYTEYELAAHALRAVNAAVGRDRGKQYRSRAALGKELGIEPPALSAALALADPHRPDATYDRGRSVRRQLLRDLLGFEVSEEPFYSIAEPASG